MVRLSVYTSNLSIQQPVAAGRCFRVKGCVFLCGGDAQLCETIRFYN